MATFQNLSLEELMSKLQDLHERRVDLVVPSQLLTMRDTDLRITHPDFVRHFGQTDDYVEEVSVRPNDIAHRQISDKLSIPKRYYDRMKADHPNLLDSNVNGWLSQQDTPYLLRSYREDEGPATGRALLSRRFKCIDNIHLLMAVLKAVQKEKLNVTVESADITEKKLYVRFIAPKAIVGGHDLLRGYKNPSTLEVGDGVMAGFTLRNSEVGMGRYEIAPRATVLVCRNGMIRERDAWGKNHVGAKLDEGVIDWSDDTYRSALHLIQNQITDYVRHFASEKYLMSWLSDIRDQGGYRLQHPVSCIENVTSSYDITQEDTQSILEYFSRSGQNTAFGIAQAVTFHAHQVGDADKRNDLEGYADDMLARIPRWDRREKINHGSLDRSAMPRTEVNGGRHSGDRAVKQYNLWS